MSKIVIIGIDGLDPLLLMKWKHVLPNLHSLSDDMSTVSIESTVPPDSICAWTSIYTGDNPAEHGLIESIDYLSNKKDEENADRSAYFRGRTFWDIAGKMGKSVCVINPFLAYPAWDVNGVMVSGPVFEGGKTSTYPENLLAKYSFPPLGGIVDFPDEKELDEFLLRTKETTEQLADVSLTMYKDYAPDLFFLTFLTLDRVQHFLWRFTDEEDTYYPGKSRFKDSIINFYVLYDKIVGQFIKSLEPDTSLLVISDHGHGRRCTSCLNLNEMLRARGYVATDMKGAKGALKKVLEKTKVFTISTMSKYGLQDWIYKIARFVPNRKALKKSTYLIDKERSPVVLSNLCGANPFGGIDIKADSEEAYEKLRDNVLSDLNNINEFVGTNVLKWAKKREQIYRGKHEKRLPDILFELDEEYGVSPDMFTSLITPNYTHKKVSGGHRSGAVFRVLGSNDSVKFLSPPDSIVGLSDYILKIINS